MDSLVIEGGIPLRGNVIISGAKNSALPIMTASLLTNKINISNVPKLTDISVMKKLLMGLGSIINTIE